MSTHMYSSSVTVVFILEFRMEVLSSTSSEFKSRGTHAVRLPMFSTGLSCPSCPPSSVKSDCSMKSEHQCFCNLQLRKRKQCPFTLGLPPCFQCQCVGHSQLLFHSSSFFLFLSLAIFCQNHHAMLLPASSMQQYKKHTRSAQSPDSGMERVSLKIKLLKDLPFQHSVKTFSLMTLHHRGFAIISSYHSVLFLSAVASYGGISSSHHQCTSRIIL